MLHGPNGQMFYGDGEGSMETHQSHSGMGRVWVCVMTVVKYLILPVAG